MQHIDTFTPFPQYYRTSPFLFFFAASFTQNVCDEQRKQLSPVTAPATVKTQ